MTIQIRIFYDEPRGQWIAVETFEPLWPIARGKDIQSAIELYIEKAKYYHNVEHLNYKWK